MNFLYLMGVICVAVLSFCAGGAYEAGRPWSSAAELLLVATACFSAGVLVMALVAGTRAPPRDAARLDWLEHMANQPGGILLHDGQEGGRLGLGLRPGTLVRTLRQAIDSAMAGEELPAAGHG